MADPLRRRRVSATAPSERLLFSLPGIRPASPKAHHRTDVDLVDLNGIYEGN